MKKMRDIAICWRMESLEELKTKTRSFLLSSHRFLGFWWCTESHQRGMLTLIDWIWIREISLICLCLRARSGWDFWTCSIIMSRKLRIWSVCLRLSSWTCTIIASKKSHICTQCQRSESWCSARTSSSGSATCKIWPSSTSSTSTQTKSPRLKISATSAN